MRAEAILSLMLSCQQPGQNVYSEVVVEQDAPAPCDEPSVMCTPPRWSRLHQGWVRYETWEEGLPRYWTLAQAIEDVAGKARWLTVALLVSACHEGGFRRDVHSGVNHLPPRGTIHEDDGESFCLIQRHLGLESEAGMQLVGIGREATRRCFEAGAEVMKRARGACSKWRANGPTCWFRTYGGVSKKVWSTKPEVRKRIRARVATWGRFDGLPLALNRKVQGLLGLEPLEDTR